VSPSPLISVHVAKAGDSSVRTILKEAYDQAFSANYQDNPANPLSQRVLDPSKYFGRRETMPAEIKCVHGHFHPGKFELTRDIVLFTLAPSSRGQYLVYILFLENDERAERRFT
jgi:hypothetical protein